MSSVLNPKFMKAVVGTVQAIAGGIISLSIFTFYKTVDLGEETSESAYTLICTFYFYLKKMIHFIGNIPSVVHFILRNIVVFFYIFCLLIVLGRFDWLLDDIYSLLGLSALLTYVSFR